MLKKRLWGGDRPAASQSGSANGTAGRQGHAAEALLLMKSFEATGAGWFWSTDEEGRLTYLSESVAQWLNGPVGHLIGSGFADMFVKADGDTTGRRSLPFLLSRHNSFEKLTLRLIGSDGSRFWSVSGSPVFDSSGRFAGYRGSAIDVTEHRESAEHVSNLARYDALTGLPNRHRMSELLDQCLLAAEHRNLSCAVLMIDLDRFKQVNDTLGHPAGDNLLKQVADRLVRIVGDREKVFRLGGDEFKIILQNIDNRGIIGDMANDIIASLSQPYSVDSSRCIIGASIGIAIAPVDGSSRDELIRNADLALYASKAAGRGRFRFFATELLEVAEDKRMLEEDLRDALARGEFAVAYQPIVCARTNVMTGVEALVRWQHPTRGAISPGLFIPIAEEAGLIGAIGDWLLGQACRDAATWPGKLRVAVNVSPIQFTNEEFPETIRQALAQSGLAPDRLELEITEGVFLGEGAHTDTLFAALKEIGIRLALDDFGTGYSSLGYLRTAPFDKIKIDQSFVHAATLPGSRNSAIIAAIVALAEALDMETTAEGIEYMDQLELVRDLRVSHVQGWIYSKAIGSAELGEKVTAGDWVIEPVGPAKQRSARQAMFRKVGLIHANRYDHAIVRNLSESGALIDGVTGLQPGSLVVVDFGDGELAFARVSRSHGRQTGIAFEQPLVDDGNGGLCTSHRVSPYLVRTAGLPTTNDGTEQVSNVLPLEELAKRLGLTLAPTPSQPDRRKARSRAGLFEEASDIPTFRTLSEHYLETLAGDSEARESAWRDLRNHVLPRFGQLRLDQVSKPDIFDWLAAKVEKEGQPAGTDSRLHGLLGQMWGLAAQLKLPGAELNPLKGQNWVARRAEANSSFTVAEVRDLLEAARTSHNRQLKFILPLLMLTGARAGELLKARWEQVDLEGGFWTLPGHAGTGPRAIPLTGAAIALISDLPRWDGCPYLLPNPVTRKPYRTIQGSWEAVRASAGLPEIELHDLRACDIGAAIPEDQMIAFLRQDAAPVEDDWAPAPAPAEPGSSLAA